MGRYITNDTDSPKFVGGRLIPPYDGRWFEDAELPPEHQVATAPAPSAPTASLDEDLAALLAGSVKSITDGLSGLTFEALERLAALETASAKPRSTLLAALEAERLHRADGVLRQEQVDQAAAAVQAAQQELQAAREAVLALPMDAAEDVRAAAGAAVLEAEARVAALTKE